jgi:hypothetical protein
MMVPGNAELASPIVHADERKANGASAKAQISGVKCASGRGEHFLTGDANGIRGRTKPVRGQPKSSRADAKPLSRALRHPPDVR